MEFQNIWSCLPLIIGILFGIRIAGKINWKFKRYYNRMIPNDYASCDLVSHQHNYVGDLHAAAIMFLSLCMAQCSLCSYLTPIWARIPLPKESP